MKNVFFSEAGIIAILLITISYIGITNYEEARSRADVATVMSDLNTFDAALSAYRVDYDVYPLGNNFSLVGCRSLDPCQETRFGVLSNLSTPISYMIDPLRDDPFPNTHRTGTINTVTGEFIVMENSISDIDSADADLLQKYSYFTPGPSGNQDVDSFSDSAEWFASMSSSGPFGHFYNQAALQVGTEAAIYNNIYDPTNGTVSIGGIWMIPSNAVRTGEGNYGDLFYQVISRHNGSSVSNSDLMIAY